MHLIRSDLGEEHLPKCPKFNTKLQLNPISILGQDRFSFGIAGTLVWLRIWVYKE